MTAIEKYYSHKSVCGYGEVSSQEQVEMALEATAEGCANIMRIADQLEQRPKGRWRWWPFRPKAKRFPPEAVATVVLMRQLVASLQENNIVLIRAMAQLFGQRRVQPAPQRPTLVH